MSHIKELFVKREDVYADFTNALKAELSTATSAAGSLVGEALQEQLVWENVLLIDDTVVITGQVKFPVGHIITSEDGDDIEVTPEMQQHLNQAIRVGLPLELAETGSYEEIVDYLDNTGHQSHKAPIEYEAENPAIETVADIAGEFRSAGLSKEQISNMIVFAEQSKGKVN
mgnify:CR=1 FL=1